MSEENPNPPAGAAAPKPAEASKVQPKKETVRINLPPKPTASPTIKIPAPAAMAAAAAAPAAPASGHAASAAPKAAAAAPAAPSRPMPRSAPTGARVSALDTVLALVAAVVGIAAVVRLFLLTQS
ncbi:MAG: hypothetical protein EXS31_03830 [Pedosphaera sp.]|nr:hypothetical protein [Pedosphaera sp.]